MEAQASRLPDLRIFQTRQLILFYRKWPVPLDVITWWIWYIYITTICCYEVVLQSNHLLVSLCHKCDWLHELCDGESCFSSRWSFPWFMLWKFSMRVCNMRLSFPRNAVTRVGLILLSRVMEHMEESRRVEGLGEVIGTAWHYRMSPGVWRLAGLSGSRQASECMLGDEWYPHPPHLPTSLAWLCLHAILPKHYTQNLFI